MHKMVVVPTVFACVLLASCGTLIGYMSECFGPGCRKPDEKSEYYQAVKTDVAIWNLPEEEGQVKWFRWASKPILLIDFPISAAVDTVFLPFQAIFNIGKKERAPNTEAKEPKGSESK